MVADADPFTLGSVSVSFDKFFSQGLTEKAVPVVFDPRTDTAYLQFTYETVTYRQFWNRQNRRAFSDALARYRTDFEAGNLSLPPAKARRAYGAVKGKTEWGQVSFSVNARAFPVIEAGYQFKGDNPYFTVFQREAENTLSSNSDRPRRSLKITLYFTRAQGAGLARVFDQSFILERLDAEGILPQGKAVPDEYPFH
jgi:hypothetical protein